MAYVSDSNLTQFWGLAKDYINAEDGRFANWLKSEKAGAVAIYPVPETMMEPVVEFAFTETAPAEGDKAPDNPSTIAGVSEVKVTRCGKNLIPYPPYSSSLPFSLRGVTVTASAEEPGALIVSGTVDGADVNFFALSATKKVTVKAGVTYTASGCPSGGNVNTYCAYIDCKRNDGSLVSVWRDTGSGVAFTPSENGYLEYIILIKGGQTVPQSIWRPQIELGSTATTFEPYEGADYTINFGSTYYGGEIDLATGLMTVKWAKVELDGTERMGSAVSVGTYTRFSIEQSILPYAETQADNTCTHFPYNNSYSGDFLHYYVSRVTGKVYLFTTHEDNTSLKAWLTSEYAGGTPVSVFFKLAIPLTVQISPLALSALAQTSRYEPRLNTVYTDAQAVQVGYVKSPIRSEFELTQAIIATEGGE